MGRFLITTADERSWKFEEPVLFLGEWCLLYDRKQKWEAMDVMVATAFGVQEKQKHAKYVYALYPKLLNEVIEQLNKLHHTNHGLRYWGILLGGWLQRYLEVMFNRYFTIRHVLKNYEINSTTVFESIDYSFATPDSLSFIWACNNDIWNNMLYARVFKHLDIKDVKLNTIHIKNEESLNLEPGSAATNYLSIKWLIKLITRYILPKLSKGNDAFIINSYLPKWQEMKLQLALGQCPQLWQAPPLNAVSIDIEMRRKFMISSQLHTGFEKFVRDLLPDMIPTCYLEGYADLNNQVKSLPWPSRPRFIFTCNNFDTDEIFKAWTGLKAEQGVPYFTGQHGNHYGTHYLYGCFSRPERSEADKFFTWGWSDGSANNIPAFIFKIANQSGVAKTDGGLLLIEFCAPHLLGFDTTYYEFGIYQEQQYRFVEALPEKIKREVTVRLHAGWRSMRWSDDRRWNDRIPSVQIEYGNAPIQALIAKSRLVVYSYDSTGILEGLALNIPTLCFLSGGLEHLLPNAKPYYELLRGAGIIADSPEQAAIHIAQHWDNIDEWWKSEFVQSARKQFCDQYAIVERYPVQTLKRLLTNAELAERVKKNLLEKH